MNVPNKIRADELSKDWPICSRDDKHWSLGRPLGLQGLFLIKRLKSAWMVFTGKADVLIWNEQ